MSTTSVSSNRSSSEGSHISLNTPYEISRLCNNCSQVFHGRHSRGMRETLVAKPSFEPGTLKPQSCRLCTFIWASHERLVNDTGINEDSAALDKIEYVFLGVKEHTGDQMALELRLGLCYTNKNCEYASLSMVPETSAQSLEVARNLPGNTGSPDSIQFLKLKLEECQNTHQICRERWNSARAWLPNRLLNVGESTSGTVYLRTRDEVEAELYFTLSHCWGDKTLTQLTTKTEASLRAGVSVQDLPKTFRDAIMITREFSIRYLWIDSLCILQDDLNDWHSEVATMCDIYSGSLANIAATAAANSSIGLFFERDSDSICSFRIHADFTIDIFDKSRNTHEVLHRGRYMLFPSRHWDEDLEHGKLNKRAWVVQERFLSTKTMHFGASQVFWECLENSSSELFPYSVPTLAQPSWMHDNSQLKRIFFGPREGKKWRDNIYTAWQILIRNYTACGLSQENDVLVAINGIQRRLAQVTGDTLVAGLWKSRLIQELSWQRSHLKRQIFRPFETQSYRAPTWSWAGRNVEIHPSNFRHHENCANLRHRITIESIELNELQSGQLRNASLQLRGKLVHAATNMYKTNDVLPGYDFDFTCGDGDKISGRTNLSNYMSFTVDNIDEESYFQQDLVFLAMWECYCDRPNGTENEKEKRRVLQALALKAISTEKDEYQRVGTLSAENAALDFYIAHETEDELSLVLL